MRDLRTRIDAQQREVQEAAKDVSAFRIDKVTEAYNNLSRAVAPVNGREAFVTALPQINQAAGELSDARVEVNTTAGC